MSQPTMHTHAAQTTINGQAGLLVAEYGINAPGDRAYFSVTGAFYPGLTDLSQVTDRTDPDFAGAIHDEISHALPWLADLISAHLCDAVTGEPMHALSNSWFWYTSGLSTETEGVPARYAPHGPAGRAALYLGTDPRLFDELDPRTEPKEVTYAKFSQSVDTLRPGWRARAEYLRSNYQLELPAEYLTKATPEPRENAYQITLGGESVRQEIEDAYQHGNNPHGHTSGEVELLTGLGDTEIGQVINNNVSDDFWQAYDSARRDVIETLTTALRQEKRD